MTSERRGTNSAKARSRAALLAECTEREVANGRWDRGQVRSPPSQGATLQGTRLGTETGSVLAGHPAPGAVLGLESLSATMGCRVESLRSSGHIVKILQLKTKTRKPQL